mmetsp:Transcript_28801/g.72474  ORF Transcript_28801/g.72474 Transcript_28801/m.72474 type:complete len:408 (-) Transcript_28801:195-1418(-)
MSPPTSTSGKGGVLDEAREHVKRVLGLVMRHKVARTSNLEEGQAGEGASVACCGAVFRTPGFRWGSGEPAGATPFHGVHPVAVAHVVADEVLHASVHKHTDIGVQQGRQEHLAVQEPVLHEVGVHDGAALGPLALGGIHAQALLHILARHELVDARHVIAQRRVVALLAHIIHVEVSSNALNLGKDQIALDHRDCVPIFLDEPLASGYGRVEAIALTFGDETVGEGKVVVLTILDARVDKAIADGKPLEVDWLALLVDIALVDAVGHGRDVVASIALTSDVEVKASVLRVSFEEGLQKLKHVLGHLSLRGDVLTGVVGVAEACTNRLVNEQNIGNRVPSPIVGSNGQIIIVYTVRAVLGENGKLRTATRATSHPQNKGVVLRVVAAFKQPVKNVSSVVVCFVDSNVP